MQQMQTSWPWDCKEKETQKEMPRTYADVAARKRNEGKEKEEMWRDITTPNRTTKKMLKRINCNFISYNPFNVFNTEREVEKENEKELEEELLK